MATETPLIDLEEKQTGGFLHSSSLESDDPEQTSEISWVSTTKIPLRDESGKIIGIMGMSRDITARKKAEEAALEATKAKSAFLATMSHEIRTPLNSVVGFSSLLLETPLNTEQKDFAESVRNSSELLLSIVNDILDFSKIEAGKIDVEEASFNLRDAVSGCLELVSPSANKKRIELCSLVDENCPEYISGDVTRLRQILINLLSNAIKFTDQGEVSLEVHCSTATTPESGKQESSSTDETPSEATPTPIISFSVKDTGIGIAPEAQRHIFDPFIQADSSTTRRFGGTGLGLAITQRLALLMNGEITLSSQPGKGSTFSLHLPLKTITNPHILQPEAYQVALNGLKAIIVDDNDTNRRYLCRQLESWGAKTIPFASGVDMLIHFKSAPICDVILMDYHMPEMDGVETTQRFKTLPGRSSTPVIMLSSAQVSSRDFPKGLFSRILLKPANPRLLRETLIALRGNPTPQTETQSDLSNLAQEHPLRILLAEDNPSNQKLGTIMLQRLGYRTDVANNGVEAIEALRERTYDVILMDLQMPEMDGIEATQTIRRVFPSPQHPWIIALTAHAAASDRDRCLEAGVNDYLTKPIRREALAAALLRIPSPEK